MNGTSFRRASGILLHITSLPGRWGIGDLGREAYRFVDWLAEAGQSYWQVLPIGPTGYGDSPYAGLSLFAGNPLLLSLDALADAGFLSLEPAASDAPAVTVDYSAVYATKWPLLRRAYAAFLDHAPADDRARFDTFREAQRDWLDPYCQFMALKDRNDRRAWWEWERTDSEPAETLFHAVLQYWFDRQWRDLLAYAHDRGVRLIGDLPIYPAEDSADVWGQPANYQLDQHRRPRAVAGVPPDYFSATGQLWGNPLYDWEVHQANGFRWWKARLRHLGEWFDVLRFDHFRGYAGYWRVPAGSRTAVNGTWVPAPGRELFDALVQDGIVRTATSARGAWCIAEDLGLITPDVDELRDRYGFPGMRVLQFAYDGLPGNPHLPHNYDRRLVAYTSTHDNDPVLGWYAGLAADQRDLVRWYVGDSPSQWSFVRQVASSVADLVIYPLQDVMGLGSEARMNRPGRASANWAWRFAWQQLTRAVSAELALLTERYGRAPAPPVHPTEAAPAQA